MDYTFVFWVKSTRICAEKKTPKGIISDIPVNNIIQHFPLRLLGFLLAIMYSMQEMFSMEFEINQKFPFPIALQTFPYLGLHLNEHICMIFISIEIFKVGFMAHNKNVYVYIFSPSLENSHCPIVSAFLLRIILVSFKDSQTFWQQAMQGI